jgi:hypothetical protein
MQHVDRRVEVRFTHNGRPVFFVGTVRSFDEGSELHEIFFDADEALEHIMLDEESCFREWRWVDHDWVGQRVRRYVADCGDIVSQDTGVAANGRIVGWLRAAENEGKPLWHVELRADGEKLEEDLEEADVVAALAAAEAAAAAAPSSSTSSLEPRAPKKKRAPAPPARSKPVHAPRATSTTSPTSPTANGELAAADEDEDENSSKRPRRAAAKKAMAKWEASEDEATFESSADELEEEGTSKRGVAKRGEARKAAAARRKKRAAADASDADDDEYEEEEEDDEGDGLDDDDDDSYSGSDRDGGGGVRKQKKRVQKTKKVAAMADGAADANRESRKLSKAEKDAEKREWEVIQRKPQPPQLKMPQEVAGYSWEREMRSKRGHLTAYDPRVLARDSNAGLCCRHLSVFAAATSRSLLPPPLGLCCRHLSVFAAATSHGPAFVAPLLQAASPSRAITTRSRRISTRRST